MASRLTFAFEDDSPIDADLAVDEGQGVDQCVVDAHAACDEGVQEADAVIRTAELSESLESLRLMLTGKTEIAQETLSVANLAIEMALAGTGVAAARIAPGLESGNVGIAVEGIGDAIVNGIKKVGAAIAKIAKSIVNFFKNIGFSMRSWIGKTKVIRAEIAKKIAAGKVEIATVNVKAYASFIVNGSPVDSFAQYSKAMKDAAGQVDKTLVAITSSIEHINKGYGLFKLLGEATKGEPTVRKFYDLAYRSGETLAKSGMFKSAGKGRFEGTAIPGSNVLWFTMPEKNEGAIAEYGQLKSESSKFHAGIKPLRNIAAVIKGKDEYTFTNIKLKEVDGLLDSLEGVVDTVIKHIDGIIRISEAETVRLEESIKSVFSFTGNVAVPRSESTGDTGSALSSWLFSGYRMMTIHHRFILNFSSNFFTVASPMFYETHWIARQILQRGQYAAKA